MDIMIIKMNRERGGTVVAVNGRVANHVHFLYRIGSRKSPLLFCINISGSERSNRGARFTQRGVRAHARNKRSPNKRNKFRIAAFHDLIFKSER